MDVKIFYNPNNHNAPAHKGMRIFKEWTIPPEGATMAESSSTVEVVGI